MKDNYGPKLVKLYLFNVERYLAEVLMLVAPRNQRQEHWIHKESKSVPLFQRGQYSQRDRSQIHLPY